MTEEFRTFWEDERGTVTVEYAIFVAVLALVGLAAWVALGEAIRSTFSAAANDLSVPPE